MGIRFSTLCVEERCALSLWLLKNVYHRTIYEKFDYFYHTPHAWPTDKPIHDPFAYIEMPDVYGPDYMGSVSNKKEKRQYILTLAIIMFVFSAISTLCTYIMYMYKCV